MPNLTIPVSTIAGITGLQTALDGKAASSHTQAISTITDLATSLAAKVDTYEVLPSDLSSLWGYWNASLETGKSNNDTLATITDQSANARSLTTTSNPTYQTNVLNGHPVYRFASNAWARITTGTIPATATVIMLAKAETAAGGTLFDGNGTNSMRCYRDPKGVIFYAGSGTTLLPFARRQFNLLIAEFGPNADSEGSVFTNVGCGRVCAGTSYVGATGFTMAAYGGGYGQQPMDVAFCAVVGRALTTEEITGLTNWARRYYRI